MFNSIYTQKKRGVLEYELIDQDSFRLAINKLGTIEDFERTVKMPVLEYLSDLHQKYHDLRKRNAVLATIKVNDDEYCPSCMTKAVLFQNYCSQCGQALLYGKEVYDVYKK